MKRNNKLTVFAAVIAMLIVMPIIYLVYEVLTHGPYPTGAGAHKDSPNGAYVASAMNMIDKVDGVIVDYYEFEVARKSDGVPINNKKLYDADQSIQFRQGGGEIFWDEDNQRVRFGTQEQTLWEFELEGL